MPARCAADVEVPGFASDSSTGGRFSSFPGPWLTPDPVTRALRRTGGGYERPSSASVRPAAARALTADGPARPPLPRIVESNGRDDIHARHLLDRCCPARLCLRWWWVFHRRSNAIVLACQHAALAHQPTPVINSLSKW